MVLDMRAENPCIKEMKVLTLPHRQKVSSCNYGPFDNGHIWMGLSDGLLLAFDYPSLKRTETILPFPCHKTPIKRILIDPTNHIIAVSQTGQVAAFTPFTRKVSYMYMELPRNPS